MFVNSKSKGNIGEAKSIAKLLELGNAVSIPFGDNERYDLVIESKTGKLLKAQVKFSSQVTKNNSLEFSLTSSKNHTTNKVLDDYDGEVDIFLLYHQVTDKVYILEEPQFRGRRSIFLRLEPTKNNQVNRVHMAVDYELTTAV